MRYLSLPELFRLHERALEQSGGSAGLRDLGGLESALAQPRMTFGGTDLYPTLPEKAAALCFSIVLNHPFVDGNKRVGYAAEASSAFQLAASVAEFAEILRGSFWAEKGSLAAVKETLAGIGTEARTEQGEELLGLVREAMRFKAQEEG